MGVFACFVDVVIVKWRGEWILRGRGGWAGGVRGSGGRWAQLVRDGNVDLTVTNYHDLMKLMCPDFQLRVIKSAFKAAWVVLRGGPRPPATAAVLPSLPKGWSGQGSPAFKRMGSTLRRGSLRGGAGAGSADRPRTTASPRLPFSKFWYCLELTWLYEPYFLSVRRYVFDSDSHKGAPPPPPPSPYKR